jgi:hypothetical protein
MGRVEATAASEKVTPKIQNFPLGRNCFFAVPK